MYISNLLKYKYKIKTPFSFISYLHFKTTDIFNESIFKFSLSFTY